MATNFGSALQIAQLAAKPANPASGRSKLYFKSDGKVYRLDSTGTETEVGGGASPGAWTAVTFTNSWANYAGYQAMQYRLFGEKVELRGVISGGGVGSSAFTLPAGYRPPAKLVVPCGSLVTLTWDAMGSAVIWNNVDTSLGAYITVNTDGTVVPASATIGIAGEFSITT